MKKFLIPFFLIIFASAAFAIAKEPQITYDNGIYHIVLSGKGVAKKIKFVSSEKLMTNREAHQTSASILTINTGFFDPVNQKTISYIITDRATTADPIFNENLMLNPILRQNMDKIINRSEFRVVECDGKYHYEIVPHKTAVDFTCGIVTSAQGGPQLLPELRLEEEFFVVRNAEGQIVRESASVLHKTARTIMGIKGNDAHIIIITDKNPMNIYEARDIAKAYGLEKALAFDGGGSTSMNYRKKIEVVSDNIGDDATGRAVKSFMILEK